MRIRTFFKKIAVCTLSAAVLLSPASALGADIQTDMTSAESQDTVTRSAYCCWTTSVTTSNRA